MLKTIFAAVLLACSFTASADAFDDNIVGMLDKGKNGVRCTYFKLGYSPPWAKGDHRLSQDIFLIDYENVQPTGVERTGPGVLTLLRSALGGGDAQGGQKRSVGSSLRPWP